MPCMVFSFIALSFFPVVYRKAQTLQMVFIYTITASGSYVCASHKHEHVCICGYRVYTDVLLY